MMHHVLYCEACNSCHWDLIMRLPLGWVSWITVFGAIVNVCIYQAVSGSLTS